MTNLQQTWANRIFFGNTSDGRPYLAVENVIRYGDSAMEDLLKLGGEPFENKKGPRIGQWKWQAIGDDAVRIGKELYPFLIPWRGKVVDRWEVRRGTSAVT